MTPRLKILHSLYLEQNQAEQLDTLAARTRIAKTVLLREAVDDMLALNGLGEGTERVSAVRNALKKARAQLLMYRKEIELKKLGLIPLQNCQAAIDEIDKAREEFGE